MSNSDNGDFATPSNDSGSAAADAMFMAAMMRNNAQPSSGSNPQPQQQASQPLNVGKTTKSALKRWLMFKAAFLAFVTTVVVVVLGPYVGIGGNHPAKAQKTAGGTPQPVAGANPNDKHGKKASHNHANSPSEAKADVPSFAQRGTIKAVVANDFKLAKVTTTGGEALQCEKKEGTTVNVAAITSQTARGQYGATAYLTDICPSVFKSTKEKGVDKTVTLVVVPPAGSTFTVSAVRSEQPTRPTNNPAAQAAGTQFTNGVD